MGDFETIRYREGNGVAWITLDRPEVHNAFDSRMRAELHGVWRSLRHNEDVGCAVLTGAGDRAFCTGIDRQEALGDRTEEVAQKRIGSQIHFDDPGADIGPKSCDLWKPVVAAVNGIACGGAFYMLGEVDVIIAAERATFFDPHVTYGMAAAFETIHMHQKIPLGELLRMQLLGAHERLSARRAHEIGLVSEVTPDTELLARAEWIAETIAARPRAAVQATVRTAWLAQEVSRLQALGLANAMLALGSDPENLLEGQRFFEAGRRVEWELR